MTHVYGIHFSQSNIIFIIHYKILTYFIQIDLILIIFYKMLTIKY